MRPLLAGSLKSIISYSRLYGGAVMKDLSRLERKVFTGPVKHDCFNLEMSGTDKKNSLETFISETHPDKRNSVVVT